MLRMKFGIHVLISSAEKSIGGIAQLVERLVRNEKARGSNPLTSSLRLEHSESDGCHAGVLAKAGVVPAPWSAPKTTAWQASVLRSWSCERLSRQV